MNRRDFIERTGRVGLLSLLPFTYTSLKNSQSYKVGYQLYSIRDDMFHNPENTLRYLASLGYQNFEIHGFDGSRGKLYGKNPIEIKKILEELQVTSTSGHYNFQQYWNSKNDSFWNYVKQSIEVAQLLGNTYMVWPWLNKNQRTPDNYKRLADTLNILGEELRKASLKLAYHNHDFEFHKINDAMGFETLLNRTDIDLVSFELDLYWVQFASPYSPMEWMAKYPGRIKMWHLKDMDKSSKDFTEFGNGNINYNLILPDPKVNGIEHFFLEQDGNFKINARESAKESIHYFQNNLSHRF